MDSPLMRASRRLTLFADFHSVDAADHVVIPAEAGDDLRLVPVPGEFVILYDGGDYQCQALVETNDGRLLDLKVDWSTWRRSDPIRWERSTGFTTQTPSASDRQAAGASH